MHNNNIAVTGASGQLGMELKALAASYPAYIFTFLSKDDLLIEDKQRVDDFFKTHSPAFLINCAAYTAVDKAETEKEKAFAINADGVANLANASEAFNARFIHVSTDYVFDGSSSTPYKESDPVQPINVYGQSKLRGEQLCMELNREAVIIRTAWVYSSFGNNFVKTMLRLMNEREAINVVNDQVGAPTYAADLAQAIMQIVEHSSWMPGIYHFTNAGKISWYDFAIAIRDTAKLNCTINPIPSSQYPTAAKRPAYSLLDTTKIQHTYNIEIRNWKDSLTEMMSALG
jgi:dTDP-4-dehydrorhamnose reductase